MTPHLGPAAGTRRAVVGARDGRDREDLVVARLQSMAAQLDGAPDPGFRATTRARLVAMAAVRTPAPGSASRLRRILTTRPEHAPPRWRTRLTAGLAGAALSVTALAAVVALSTGAGPGDALYGVKRGAEQTRLALASDAERGQTLLDLASTRLHELDALLAAGSSAQQAAADPGLVLATLTIMDRQTGEGAAWLARRSVDGNDAAALDDLSSWTGGQTEGLLALRRDVPAGAEDAFTASLGLLTRVEERVAGLRTALLCPGEPAVAGADELGPVPLPTCPAAAPTSGSQAGTPPSSGSSGTGLPPSTGAAGPTGGAPATGTGGGAAGSTGPLDPGTGGQTPSLPTDVLPTPPSRSAGPLPTLPRLPLPGGSPAPDAGVGICVPPLLAVGDC